MPDLQIRPASVDDLEAINDIYNHYVIHSVTTYQEEPESIESRQAWFARHGNDHPVTVATIGSEIVGWGSLSPFHTRSAYHHTVENSVYVHPQHLRRGIGTALLSDLIRRAIDAQHHSIVALIDAAQAYSIAMHRKMGFVEVAHLKEVGHKFGRWLDVIYLQKMLLPVS